MVKFLGGVDGKLFTKIVIQRFKVLLVVGPVAAELDNIGGIVGCELCVKNLEVIARAAIRLAFDFDVGIGRLEQVDSPRSKHFSIAMAR